MERLTSPKCPNFRVESHSSQQTFGKLLSHRQLLHDHGPMKLVPDVYRLLLTNMGVLNRDVGPQKIDPP